jgi:CIC family chloride channel protein
MTFKQTALSKYLDRLAPPVGLLLLILSIAIGAGTGLAAVAVYQTYLRHSAPWL